MKTIGEHQRRFAAAACCAALTVKWREKANESRRQAKTALGWVVAAEWYQQARTLDDCAAELEYALAQHNEKAQRPGT